MPSSGRDSATRIVQVSNVSPSASREQLYHMFGYFGHIDEMKVYPSETSPLFASVQSKLCFIKYDDNEAVDAAQHMTNTVFIDRALVCVPVIENKIPDEETAMKVGGPALGGQRQLPPNIMNQIQIVGSQQLMVTIDPSLAALGLPPYPPLPSNTDAVKMEEIRRTVYVGNIPKDAKPTEIVDFFNEKIGEVMYLRMAGDENLTNRYAYVEFTNQHSVPTSLQNNGIEFGSNKLRIQHSTVAIIKPLVKTQDMAKKEVEDALKNAEATNPTMGKGVDVDEVLRRFTSSSPLVTSGSRSPPSHRARSRSSQRRRSRSRSRHASTRKSSSRRRSGSRIRASHSRRRSKSRTPGRSRDRRQRTKSKSKERYASSSRRVSRSKSRERRRIDKDRDDKSSDRKEKEKDRHKEKEKEVQKVEKKEKDRRSKDHREDRDEKRSSSKYADDQRDGSRHHRKEKRRSRKGDKEKHSSRKSLDELKKSGDRRTTPAAAVTADDSNLQSNKRKNDDEPEPMKNDDKIKEEPTEKKFKEEDEEDKFIDLKPNEQLVTYGPALGQDTTESTDNIDSSLVKESLQDLFTAAENYISSKLKTEDRQS